MFYSFAIIAFAALIHTSFQLSISMLTLLSGHAIGRKTAHAKLLRRTSMFSAGVALVTMLLLSFFCLLLSASFGSNVPPVAWAIGCGLLFGLGIAVWAFYYRREPGTSLWIPRSIARYIMQRTKATKSSAEAFSLGMSSVIGELLFSVAPLLIAALAIIELDSQLQLAGIALYTAVSLLSLGIVTMLIGGGHKISRIQQWREANKHFLQFAAGSGLIVLGVYVYVDKVVAVAHALPGGM